MRHFDAELGSGSSWQLVCYILVAIFGLAGNGIVIAVLRKSSVLLRSRAVNVCIFALSVACLIQSVAALGNYLLVAKYLVAPSSTAGDVICKTLVGYPIPDALTVLSFFLLVMAVVDCRLAITNPPSLLARRPLSYMVTWVVFLLVLALAATFPWNFGLAYTKEAVAIGRFCKAAFPKPVGAIVFVVQFLIRQAIPVVITVSSLIRIRLRMVRLRRAVARSMVAPGHDRELILHHTSTLQRYASVVTLRFLIVAHFLLVFPSQLMTILHSSFSVQKVAWNAPVFQAALVLKFSYCALMPPLLMLTSARFRRHLRLLLFPQSMDSHVTPLMEDATADTGNVPVNGFISNDLNIEQVI